MGFITTTSKHILDPYTMIICNMQDTGMHLLSLSLSPYPVPGKVRSLKVFNISSTQLRIAWLAPQSGTVGGYEVKVETAEEDVQLENTANTSIIISNLCKYS